MLYLICKVKHMLHTVIRVDRYKIIDSMFIVQNQTQYNNINHKLFKKRVA